MERRISAQATREKLNHLGRQAGIFLREMALSYQDLGHSSEFRDLERQRINNTLVRRDTTVRQLSETINSGASTGNILSLIRQRDREIGRRARAMRKDARLNKNPGN